MNEKSVCFEIEGMELVSELNLVEYNEIPVFFVCKSAEKRFLVLCIDLEGEKYLVTEISTYHVLRMLDSSETMRECFMNGIKYWRVEAAEDIINDRVERINKCDIALGDLPVEGARYKITSSEVLEYSSRLMGSIFDSEAWNKLVDSIEKSLEEVIAVDEVAISKALRSISNACIMKSEYIECFTKALQFEVESDGLLVRSSISNGNSLCNARENCYAVEGKKLLVA